MSVQVNINVNTTVTLANQMTSAFSDLVELANVSVGGTILFSTDDFFAVAEGMLDNKDPVWLADKYHQFGSF